MRPGDVTYKAQRFAVITNTTAGNADAPTSLPRPPGLYVAPGFFATA
jgi:hypothetical protein